MRPKLFRALSGVRSHKHKLLWGSCGETGWCESPKDGSESPTAMAPDPSATFEGVSADAKRQAEANGRSVLFRISARVHEGRLTRALCVSRPDREQLRRCRFQAIGFLDSGESIRGPSRKRLRWMLVKKWDDKQRPVGHLPQRLEAP